jgi:hypothetical protein
MIYQDEIQDTTQSISSVLSVLAKVPSVKGPTHELAATVDEISKVVPLTKKYGFGFWLKLVQKSRVSYTEMFGILKEISRATVDKTGRPYNKGALLVSKLKKICLSKQSTK